MAAGSPLRRSAIHRCSPARHCIPFAAGFVKNAVNGQGVAGVNLTFTSGPNVGKSVVTGVDGSYTFSSLLQVPLGTLEVRTSARQLVALLRPSACGPPRIMSRRACLCVCVRECSSESSCLCLCMCVCAVVRVLVRVCVRTPWRAGKQARI